MPRKKKRSVPLTREAALKAEDEFMLNYGHMSLWYDGWYNSRGKAIIETRRKALAEWEAHLPTVRLPSEEMTVPATPAVEGGVSRGDKAKRARGIRGRGVVGFAAMRKHVANDLAKIRAARSKTRAKGGD